MSDRVHFKPKSHPTSNVTFTRQSTGEVMTSFEDMDEVIKAMSRINPNTGKAYYDESPTYRAKIQEMLAVTPAEKIGVQLEARQAIPTDEEFMKGLIEDAARQRFAQLVDRAGGSDAIAKLELARQIKNPSQEQREEFGVIQNQTDYGTARPHEQYLKNRQAAGLGPWRETISAWDAETGQAAEDAHNKEILDWMASQEIDSDVDMGGNR